MRILAASYMVASYIEYGLFYGHFKRIVCVTGNVRCMNALFVALTDNFINLLALYGRVLCLQLSMQRFVILIIKEAIQHLLALIF